MRHFAGGAPDGAITRLHRRDTRPIGPRNSGTTTFPTKTAAHRIPPARVSASTGHCELAIGSPAGDGPDPPRLQRPSVPASRSRVRHPIGRQTALPVRTDNSARKMKTALAAALADLQPAENR